MSRELVQLHLGRADECLRAATELVRDGLFRDSVGRAYYAMFHAAHALLATKGLDAKTHRGLVHVFGDQFVSNGKVPQELWDEFRKAKELRESGDYDVGFLVEEGEAETVVTKAAEFVDFIGGII